MTEEQKWTALLRVIIYTVTYNAELFYRYFFSKSCKYTLYIRERADGMEIRNMNNNAFFFII